MRHELLGPYEVAIPQTRRERARGLLGHDILEPGAGLLLERCRSVHTFGMRFPIDAVLLDRRWRVIAVVQLAPRRLLIPRPRVRHVLEVAPGTALRPGLRLTRRAAAPA